MSDVALLRRFIRVCGLTRFSFPIRGDRSPDDFKIHFEVPMRERIAHLIGDTPRHIGMLRRKSSVITFDIARRLTDDFKIPNHGVWCLQCHAETQLISRDRLLQCRCGAIPSRTREHYGRDVARQ